MQKPECWDLAMSENGFLIVAKCICFTISYSILTCHNFWFIHLCGKLRINGSLNVSGGLNTGDLQSAIEFSNNFGLFQMQFIQFNLIILTLSFQQEVCGPF